MTNHLRSSLTGLGLVLALAGGVVACGGGESAEDRAERQVREAIDQGMADAGVEGDIPDLGDIPIGDGEGGQAGTLSLAGGDLPEGFPSQMPIFDPEASPIGGVSIVDGNERRLGVTFQVDATEDEVIDFYRAELPGSGWTVEEPDQVSVPMLNVEGHGYDGAVTVQVAGGVTSLSFSFTTAA